jgi:hypothetical protein
MQKKKEEQVKKAINFTISILVFVVIMEGIDHVYVLKLPGSPIKRMSFAFYFLCHIVIFKILLSRYKLLENYAAFVISASCMINLTERGIYLSPTEFKLAHL